MVKEQRTVSTPFGEVTYQLVRKRVKNLNLHLERDGRVILSVPVRCPADYADRFIAAKGEWILRGQEMLREVARVELPPIPPRAECVALLRRAV